MTWLTDLLDTQALILLLILLFAVRAFGRMVESPDNNVKASDFYSSLGRDGREHGDPDKLAKMVGVFASTLFVGYTFWAHPLDNFWPVAVFGFWLIFISRISVFSAWARSFVDRRFGRSGDAPPVVEQPPGTTVTTTGAEGTTTKTTPAKDGR